MTEQKQIWAKKHFFLVAFVLIMLNIFLGTLNLCQNSRTKVDKKNFQTFITTITLPVKRWYRYSLITNNLSTAALAVTENCNVKGKIFQILRNFSPKIFYKIFWMKELYLEKGYLSHRKNIIGLQKTTISCGKKNWKQKSGWN